MRAELTAWLDELTALSKGVDRCDETNRRTWEEKNNLLIRMVELGKRALLAERWVEPAGMRASMLASDVYGLKSRAASI